MKHPVRRLGLATSALVGTLVASSVAASAAIVCNKEGDCWHARGRYAYKPDFGLIVHPDNWRWGRDEKRFRWREHAGRGYWRNGVWIGF